MTSTPPRPCSGCGEALTQKINETTSKFQRRKTCGPACATEARRNGLLKYTPPARALAKEQARESAWLERLALAEEAKGSMTFEKQELVQAARRAAPTMPARVLADVLREVEPLIAANVRTALLGSFAHAARPFLPGWVPPEERGGEKVS